MIPRLIVAITLSGLVAGIILNYLDLQQGLDASPLLNAFPEYKTGTEHL